MNTNSLEKRLARAVEGNDHETAREVATGQPEILNEPDPSGFLPLHRAIRHENIAMVKLLLKLGADPHAQEDTGIAAVEVAAASNSVEIIRALFEAGADLRAKTSTVLDPTMPSMEEIARRNGNKTVAEEIRKLVSSLNDRSLS